MANCLFVFFLFFAVQIMNIMQVADEVKLIPWKSVLEKKEWIDALECSTTFAQIVFYIARLRFYQTRPQDDEE